MLVKTKLAPGKEDFVQDCCNRRKRPEFSLSSIPLKQRDEEFLKPGAELDHKPPVFLIRFTKGKVNFLITGGSFTAWSKVSHRS